VIRSFAAIACGCALGAANVGQALSPAELKQALDKSTSTGKPLLAVAGAEWCGPCKLLDKQLHTDKAWMAAGEKLIYVHIDVDKDKEAWKAFTGKYKTPGNGIPMIFIVKPGGELGFSQCGYSPKLLETFQKFAGEKFAAKATMTLKEIAALRTATKEAKDLLDKGKFASAYNKLVDYADQFDGEAKPIKDAKRVFDLAVNDAVKGISAAVKDAKEPYGFKRFDAAYHLTIISRTFNEAEAVKDKAGDAIAELEKDEKTSALLKQAALYDQGRQAEKEEDAAKAKEIYAKLIKDFDKSPGAKKAQERLTELASTN